MADDESGCGRRLGQNGREIEISRCPRTRPPWIMLMQSSPIIGGNSCQPTETCFEGLDHTDYRGKSGVKAHTPDVDLVLEVLAKGWRRFTHNALVNRPSW